MKKIITLSLIAATLLFTGCGEETKKAVAEATAKTVETTKDATNKAVEATKEAVTEAKEATAKAIEATKEATQEAVKHTEKAVDTVVTGTVDMISDNKVGKETYAKCTGCHGKDGKTKALGKSPEIAGQSKEELVTKLNGYKAGTRNESGMGNLMKGQVATMDNAAIEAVATYISTLK
jgi:cytochrome c553